MCVIFFSAPFLFNQPQGEKLGDEMIDKAKDLLRQVGFLLLRFRPIQGGHRKPVINMVFNSTCRGYNHS